MKTAVQLILRFSFFTFFYLSVSLSKSTRLINSLR